jgi:hypothetical protein
MSKALIEDLADALQSIADGRLTCVLRISTDNGLRMAFFEEGDLVYFVSEDDRERLIDYLGAPERFGAFDTLAALHAPNRPLVAQMLDAGLCDADRLRPWLVAYARECFARAFDDRAGWIKVMPKVRADHPVPFRVSARVVALESVRGMSDLDLVREMIGPLTNVATPLSDHMERLIALPLDYQEGAVGSQLDAPLALKDLVAVSHLPEPEGLRALLALRCAGVLAPFEPPKELTDTGRLRMRQQARESAVAVDATAAAVALGMANPVEEAPAGRPLTMSEFAQAPTWSEPEPAPPPPSPEPEPPKRTKGESGQLRVLASVYVQMAEAEAQAGNFNGAMQYFETAHGQKPGELTVVLPFVKYLTSVDRAGMKEMAERLLRQACVMNPRSVEPRLELARVCRLTGRNAQALDVLAEAERIAPRDPRVREMLDGKRAGGLFARFRGQ